MSRERAALTRYGDRSGSEAVRTAVDAFLGRTKWGVMVRKWADAAARVWWKRSVPAALTNTDGDPLLLIDATVTVSGEVTGRLSARGGRPIDTEWLRTELGLTAPLSERAWTLTR